MPRHHWTGPVLISLLLSGCADSPEPPEIMTRDAGTSNVSTDAEPARPVADAVSSTVAEIPLEIKSWDGLQDWIASQPGKIVVVDVWATFCMPCLLEFPHFVELHEEYKDRVACASLNIDFYGGAGDRPEYVRPKVLQILSSQNATMANFISSDPDETILKHISSASIPAALVYDRQGTLHKVFHNDTGEYGPDGFTYERDIIPLVKQLLRSSS